MSQKAKAIWILVASEAAMAVCVFFFSTSVVWESGVHGRYDDFQGSYWRLITSVSSRNEFDRAIRQSNLTEYWGEFWPEHLIAAVGVWFVWWIQYRNRIRWGSAVPISPCPKCGYNLIGQIMAGIGRCPECGETLTQQASDAAPP